MHRAARDVRMYERHFDLTDRPFGATPDPDFYFDSKGHARALAFLRYAIAQGDGLVVMTGGSGTGKTTLVHKILGELDPKAIAWAHLVSSQLDASDLLRAVSRLFGVALPGVASRAASRAAFQSRGGPA